MSIPQRLVCLLLFVLPGLHPAPLRSAEAEPLPGTTPLTWDDNLADRMMDGLHRFVERKISDSVQSRAQHWKRDQSSAAAYEASIAPNRARFSRLIGIADARLPVTMERFGDEERPALVAEVAGSTPWSAFQVRWPVLSGVHGTGLLLVPAGTIRGDVVVLPDADQTPEQAVGLAPGIDPASQTARHLVESGFRVIVPVLIDRSDEMSGSPHVAFTNQPHREWIYRQAYHMGRHVIGYEVQKVLSAVDWFRQSGPADRKLGVAGYGEGGLIAFYAAAVDPRIDACLVSGCFDPHRRPWEEPLYRNVWSLLREFGDAELATMIAPRALIVEHSRFPQVEGPPAVRPGRRGGAAAGRLVTPPLTDVAAEFNRIDDLLKPGFQSRRLVPGEGDQPARPGSAAALAALTRALGSPTQPTRSDTLPQERRKGLAPAERQAQQVQELEQHVQRLVRGSDRLREEFFRATFGPAPQSLEQAAVEAGKARKYLWEEVFGKFDDPLLPMNVRTRKVYDREKWVGYDVVLDVHPDVFAWGVLLLPRDLKPGERRPVVVCQHGRAGVPGDVIEGDKPAYHDFAARLAERGFITFAPHNPYRGEDRYRFLSRKANAIKGSLFSFILSQHQQILNFLQALPQVDPQRIAFYGLSYGGETAVRVPPLLERYCLSICSADFNDWARKIAATDARYTFMFTVEWEMPYFDMGRTFNYAEMAQLMLPRPFMVERGHADGVAPDEWVAYEYAKVRRAYDLFGLGDRTEMEVFNGGHTINGQGTFRFLERQLKYPPAAPEPAAQGGR